MEKIKQYSETKRAKWFDEMIAALRKDELLLDKNMASRETQSNYKLLIEGTREENAIIFKKKAVEELVNLFLLNYIKEISHFLKEQESKSSIKKIAVSYGDEKLLIWAEIKEDSEEAEDALLIAQAKINAKYIQSGFAISTMVVEDVDNLAIPAPYQLIYPV